jgi:biopolymer transport protein TolR
MGAQINMGSGRRRGRGRRSFKPSSEINVTPLVDVMLVLLVIFMVTAPMLTVGVNVDLPKTHAAKMNDNVDPLIISVNAQGKIYLQETEFQPEDLIPRLMAITGSNPDAKVYVRGDEKIAYGKVMETMGMIAAAGFTKVSLIAEMPNTPLKKTPKLPTGQVAPHTTVAPVTNASMHSGPHHGVSPLHTPSNMHPTRVQ